MLKFSLTLCVGAVLFAVSAAPKTPPAPGFGWERNEADYAVLPVVTVKNPTSETVKGELMFSLADTAGRRIYEKRIPYELEAGRSAKLTGFEGRVPAGRIVLAMVEGAGLKAEQPGVGFDTDRLSGIFGTPRRLNRENRDFLVGMNVHLEKYTPAIRWELMRMLRDAGVKSVRIDGYFCMPDDRKHQAVTFRRLDEVILGLEAFGIEPLVGLMWFPKRFYNSPEKQKAAFLWAKQVAERYKGRASWHYGNETNSGWAGFGAAADMAALHKAFALGTRAGDPEALRGTFGIAEGLPGYLEKFLEHDTLDYLDAVAVHPYSGTAEAGIAKTLANKELLRPGQQIWATELGYQVDDTKVGMNALTGQLTQVMGFTSEQQADLMSRLYILGRAFGVDRIYWYDFYGLKDGETFWVVNPDLTPKPAYHALVKVAREMAEVKPLGGTELDEAIQRHYFRCTDNRILLTAWALNGKGKLAVPSDAAVTDALDRPVPVPADGMLRLSTRPLFIRLPADGTFDGFLNQEVLASAFDRRSFSRPSFRLAGKPGEKIAVPFSLYNSSEREVTATPCVVKRLPGWKIDFEARPVVLAPQQTVTVPVTFTSLPDAVPGVEYHFAMAAELDNGQRTSASPVRIRLNGKFPYREIMEFSRAADYPMWDSMDEAKFNSGNPELSASAGSATVDGKLDEWRPEEFFELDQRLTWKLRDPKLPSSEDFTAKIAFRYDREYLYAGIIIRDDDLSVGDDLSRDWRDSDNVRIFLSTESDPAKRPRRISEKELLLIMSPTDLSRTGGPVAFAAVLGGHARPGFEQKIRLDGRVWNTGSVIEVAIPWHELGVAPEPGRLLGLNVLADDADKGFRRHTAMTYLHDAEYWRSPTSLGGLRLK